MSSNSWAIAECRRTVDKERDLDRYASRLTHAPMPTADECVAALRSMDEVARMPKTFEGQVTLMAGMVRTGILPLLEVPKDFRPWVAQTLAGPEVEW